MASLLQEIISVYPLLNPSQLTAAASNRVCNALALLQCVASHNETRTLFLNGTNVPNLRTGQCLHNRMYSTHTPFPVSVPQHDIEVQTIRVSASYIARRYWCVSQE